MAADAYAQKLEAARHGLPFGRWQAEGFDSVENCQAFERIFEGLVQALIAAGENATEATKLAAFEAAVRSLNRHSASIDTASREDLCELIDDFGALTGLDPEAYGDGDGIASAWRDW